MALEIMRILGDRARVADGWRAERHVFARRIAEVGLMRGLLVDPTFDQARFRLLDSGRAIDLSNPWHLTGCRGEVDEHELAALLAPTELGEAGYLGRLDIVRQLLGAGEDPNAPAPDGVLPIRRTLAAWVTVDLHVMIVKVLLDAGLIVDRSQIGSLLAESVWNEFDREIAGLLDRRGLPRHHPLDARGGSHGASNGE